MNLQCTSLTCRNVKKIKGELPYAQSRNKAKQFLLSFSFPSSSSGERRGGDTKKNLCESLFLRSGKISNRYELFRINYSLIRFLMVPTNSCKMKVKQRSKLDGFISQKPPTTTFRFLSEKDS